MTRALGPGLKPPWALLGVAAALAVVLALEWGSLAGSTSAAATTIAAQAPAPATARKFDPPPAQLYAEIAERPLFVPGRRPQADSADANAKAPVKPPALAVQGVVLAPDQRFAVIAHGNPLRYDAIAEGGTVEGWHIDSIDRDRVALSAGGAKIEVPVAKFDTEPNTRRRPQE